MLIDKKIRFKQKKGDITNIFEHIVFHRSNRQFDIAFISPVPNGRDIDWDVLYVKRVCIFPGINIPTFRLIRYVGCLFVLGWFLCSDMFVVNMSSNNRQFYVAIILTS